MILNQSRLLFIVQDNNYRHQFQHMISGSQTSIATFSASSTINVSLLQVLTILTERLSQTTYPTFTHQQILIKLLYQIDPSYFQYKFALQQTYDYQSILKSLIDYYNDRKYEKIKKTFVMELNYVHKFLHVFRLVLDLAMNYHEEEKQRYIEEIINMSEREKEILMPYVDQVMKRKFITELSQYKKYTDSNHIEHTQEEQLLETKDSQYQQLYENYQKLSQQYHQLQQNHTSLKISHQKILQQNSLIVQQKYQLMNQLGVHTSTTFMEIAEKYKKDIKQFIREFQRLNKEIEEKNNRIKSKEAEIKRLSGFEGTVGLWEQEKNSLLQRYWKIEAELKNLQNKEQKLREELDSTKILVKKLKEESALKQQQINVLNKIKQRHKGIKQYHYEFKKRFNEKMKEI